MVEDEEEEVERTLLRMWGEGGVRKGFVKKQDPGPGLGIDGNVPMGMEVLKREETGHNRRIQVLEKVKRNRIQSPSGKISL